MQKLSQALRSISWNSRIASRCFERSENMQAILEQNIIAERVLDRTKEAFGTKIGLLGTIFGCWHKEMTRPFTNKKGSYRACLNCGARKEFDIKSFKTLGTFYYPPSVASRP